MALRKGISKFNTLVIKIIIIASISIKKHIPCYFNLDLI